ncbi:MAG: type II secretion system protein M [Lachnospiraceae bacterium]|nr:type II secretion system protein M [Lachnospiraceae bacterium]
MKILSRDFTTREKVLILILAIILLILAYYWLVDVPVRNGIMEADSKRESTEIELTAVNAKIAGLEQMQRELEELGSSGRAAYMASYNNAEAEYAALNDILSGTDEYLITFSDLTKEGDLVRRQFSIQFSTTGYAAAKKIITDLENSEYRCRIGDISCAAEQGLDEEIDLRNWNGRILVNGTATFYETMVGGTPDEGLPADEGEE